MNLEDLAKDVHKIRYQIEILSECVDYERYPVQSLILMMNWDESQINKAHDIFEEYDKLLRENNKVNWSDFESKLRNEFTINYQTVKSIILAFYRNHQWTEVCHGYAMSFEPSTPVEFHCITRRNE
jgi:hypothetical protein